MNTTHRIHFENSRSMSAVPAASVHLVVTSPPYPMIEMWDEVFSGLDPRVRKALNAAQAWKAFELMHGSLDPVWSEVHRVLVDGGIACINIGDATRTIGGGFGLYPNHSRILRRLLDLGFTPLPLILWRKQTNAPNKFMGSGMLPPGAYVTLEHEYIIIARKGAKRPFPSIAAKQLRQQSAFFWEERNQWFSDVWFDLKGARQDLLGGAGKEVRSRSGAFPFELPYRLISMFSVKGDTVLDPFLGLGTTLLAAMAAGRNSIGFEIDSSLAPFIDAQVDELLPFANARIQERLREHERFLESRLEKTGAAPKHRNRPHGFAVVTSQETELELNELLSIRRLGDMEFAVDYADTAALRRAEPFSAGESADPQAAPSRRPAAGEVKQLELFENFNLE